MATIVRIYINLSLENLSLLQLVVLDQVQQEEHIKVCQQSWSVSSTQLLKHYPGSFSYQAPALQGHLLLDLELLDEEFDASQV